MKESLEFITISYWNLFDIMTICFSCKENLLVQYIVVQPIRHLPHVANGQLNVSLFPNTTKIILI